MNLDYDLALRNAHFESHCRISLLVVAASSSATLVWNGTSGRHSAVHWLHQEAIDSVTPCQTNQAPHRLGIIVVLGQKAANLPGLRNSR
jgi:hypothetical protein